MLLIFMTPSLINSLRNTHMTPWWLCGILIYCHYMCCHETMGSTVYMLNHMSYQMPLQPICPVMETSGACHWNDVKTGMRAPNPDDHDPLTVIYEYITHNIFNTSDPPTPEPVNVLPPIPALRPVPNMVLPLVILSTPCVLLLASIMPSMYVRGFHRDNPMKLLNSVFSFSLGIAVICMISYETLGLRYLSPCIALHAALHCCHAVGDLLSSRLADSVMLLPWMGAVAMAVASSVIVGIIAISGFTSLAYYTPLSFFSCHLVATVLVEAVQSPLWYLATSISA